MYSHILCMSVVFVVIYMQVKEDINTLIHALTPILYITKSGVPKPPFLDPSVIQHWIDKVRSFFLLTMMMCESICCSQVH